MGVDSLILLETPHLHHQDTKNETVVPVFTLKLSIQKKRGLVDTLNPSPIKRSG